MQIKYMHTMVLLAGFVCQLDTNQTHLRKGFNEEVPRLGGTVGDVLIVKYFRKKNQHSR